MGSRWRIAPAVAVAVAVLAGGCSAPERTGPTRLKVVYVSNDPRVGPDANGKAPERVWTLTCPQPSGTHPDPQGACAALAATERPFAKPSGAQMCTDVYGGPQTARVTGMYLGQKIARTFTRSDGCEIARWDGLAPLLPDVSGTLPQ